MNATICQEIPADHGAVAKLIEAAFQTLSHSDHQEQLLVERLRHSDAFIPELSMVAKFGGEIVGHILLTKVKIKNEQQAFDSLALAPVSVKPTYQKRGIGGQLINAAHQQARILGFKSIVLIGHENYYPKFGYELASKYSIKFPFEAPDQNCMALELIKNGLEGVNGMVEYAREFGI